MTMLAKAMLRSAYNGQRMLRDQTLSQFGGAGASFQTSRWNHAFRNSGRLVYLSLIPKAITEPEIVKKLEQFGPVDDFEIVSGGKPLPLSRVVRMQTARVTFANEESARKALERELLVVRNNHMTIDENFLWLGSFSTLSECVWNLRPRSRSRCVAVKNCPPNWGWQEFKDIGERFGRTVVAIAFPEPSDKGRTTNGLIFFREVTTAEKCKLGLNGQTVRDLTLQVTNLGWEDLDEVEED